ncbi:DUF6233 domain-containing protein [Streptomyces sp. NPDC048623]|uniref:DUF6233 domain-containing protein n=1 Tax=Streptomyces sp. NPDC048623 TaxID=3155761 RepID=UPI00341E4B65
MLDLPDDLSQLRTLERLALIILRDIRLRIDEVEQRQKAMRPVRVLPDGPGWVVSYLREHGRRVPDAVHIGDCSLAGPNKAPVGREEARRALADGSVRSCDICRPETALGIPG